MHLLLTDFGIPCRVQVGKKGTGKDEQHHAWVELTGLGLCVEATSGKVYPESKYAEYEIYETKIVAYPRDRLSADEIRDIIEKSGLKVAKPRSEPVSIEMT